MYKAIFISHAASRTGAPKYLLNLLGYLKENLNIEITTLILESGPLDNSFKKYGKTFLIPKLPFTASLFIKALDRLINLYERKRLNIFKSFKKVKFNFIYANTVASFSVAIQIKKDLGIPLIIHIHELPFMLQTYCNNDDFIEAIELADKIIAVSSAVEEMLLTKYNVVPNKIIKTYVPLNTNIEYTNCFVTEKLFTIVGSGSLNTVKGPDIFIQIAKLFYLKYPNSTMVFKWIGGEKNSYEYKMLIHDINLAKLTNKVIITGEVNNPRDFFRDADVLLLSSREDTFPTVALENAYEGNPIVCFKEATGLSEIINPKNGLTVEFMDLNSIVEELNLLSTGAEYYKMKSDNIRKICKNYSIEKVCLPILNEIKAIIK